MKKIFYILIVLMTSIFMANAQDSLYIFNSGNLVFKYPVMSIDSITFSKNYPDATSGDTTNTGKENYSSLTVEQHKQAIEEQGILLLQKIDSLKYLKSAHVMKDFILLMDSASGPEMNKEIAQYVKTLDGKQQVKSMSANAPMLPTIAQVYSQLTGIYSYDPVNNQWIRTENNSEIRFEFPSGGSAINNASVTLANFSSIPSPTVMDLGGVYFSLITSLKLTVNINNADVFAFRFAGSYNVDGIPTYMNAVMNFSEGFKIVSTFVNLTSRATYDNVFSNSTSEIMSQHFEVNGNLDYNKILDGLDSNSNASPIEVLDQANAYMTIGNLRIVALADFTGLNSDMNDVNSQVKESVDSAVVTLNNHTSIYIKYVDANNVIAKSEFYTHSEIKTDYVWNENTQSYEMVEYTKYIPEMKMQFQDGSAIDGSFFDLGFETLKTNLEEFGKAMDENYK